MDLQKLSNVYNGNCRVYLEGEFAVVKDSSYLRDALDYTRYFVSGNKSLEIYDSRQWTNTDEYNKLSYVVIYASPNRESEPDKSTVVIFLRNFNPAVDTFENDILNLGTIVNGKRNVYKLKFTTLKVSAINEQWTAFVELVTNMRAKAWCVRCMCGRVWVLNLTTFVDCDCGANLFREGDTCRAEVSDDYDLWSQPYVQPSIFEEEL